MHTRAHTHTQFVESEWREFYHTNRAEACRCRWEVRGGRGLEFPSLSISSVLWGLKKKEEKNEEFIYEYIYMHTFTHPRVVKSNGINKSLIMSRENWAVRHSVCDNCEDCQEKKTQTNKQKEKHEVTPKLVDVNMQCLFFYFMIFFWFLVTNETFLLFLCDCMWSSLTRKKKTKLKHQQTESKKNHSDWTLPSIFILFLTYAGKIYWDHSWCYIYT